MHQQIKHDLASAYRLCAMMNMDDLTYSHISARALDEDAFFIAPFGMLFEEITPDSIA
jgi:ribulose-5-phosphate 4-epimerase/fuculose-1-phosphate aldolase